MTASSSMFSNEKKDMATRPYGSKKKKKKKKTVADPTSKKTYEQVTDTSFIMDPEDWLSESYDEYSFDDVSAMVQKAVKNEYTVANHKTAYGAVLCRYYVYKLWPDKVALKRSYDNDMDDPLFVMHNYNIKNGKAMLEPGYEIDLGFVPAGSQSQEFMVAVRESDQLSVDDPKLASRLVEEGEEENPPLEEEEEPEEYEELGDEDDVEDDGDASDDDDPIDDDEEPDEEEVTESALREDIANVREQNFVEQFDNAIDGSCRITEGKDGSFIIENMAVIGLKSKNGREYPTDTRKRALKLFEGAKAYANHPKKGEEDNARGIAEVIGRHRNVYYDPKTDMVRSNLHLSPTDFVKGYIIPHAKANPSLIGNSINGGGKLTESGKVMEITKIHSIDLVTDPATTSGLFEHVENKNPKPKGAKSMDIKEILDDKELAEELREHFREEFDVENSVADLQEENESLRAELKEFKLKEEQEAREAEIDTLLSESKLSDEDKKDPEIRQILLDAKPERRKALLERFEKAATGGKYRADGAAPSGQRLTEGTDAGNRLALATRMHRALTPRR